MGMAVKDKVVKTVEDRLSALDTEVTDEEKTFEEQIAPKRAERDELRALLDRVKGTSKTRKSGRRRGGGRQAEFVKIVANHPGISVSEAAREMDVAPNYLYRVAADAIEAGKVRKDGREFHAITSDEDGDAQAG